MRTHFDGNTSGNSIIRFDNALTIKRALSFYLNIERLLADKQSSFVSQPERPSLSSKILKTSPLGSQVNKDKYSPLQEAYPFVPAVRIPFVLPELKLLASM